MNGYLLAKHGGLSTTVQDLGRVGFQSLGIPVSGALDPINLRLANALVGNREGQGALEIRYLGPVLQVEADGVRVALTGTNASIEIVEPEARSIPSGRSVTLRRGSVFRISAISDTACCYLAIAGGLAVPEVFGSQSTYARGGVGGLNGRTISAGDKLPLVTGVQWPDAERVVARGSSTGYDGPIRVVLGPQVDYFTDAGLETFLTSTYIISREADRMGIRLDGPRIQHSKGFNIPSDGIVTGSVQVPGTGLPIVLLADRQTTGGYPKIGSVISTDLPRFGRFLPGDAIRFSAVTVAEAESIRRAEETRVAGIIRSIAPLASHAMLLERALLTENLISGGEWIVEDDSS